MDFQLFFFFVYHKTHIGLRIIPLGTNKNGHDKHAWLQEASITKGQWCFFFHNSSRSTWLKKPHHLKSSGQYRNSLQGMGFLIKFYSPYSRYLNKMLQWLTNNSCLLHWINYNTWFYCRKGTSIIFYS